MIKNTPLLRSLEARADHFAYRKAAARNYLNGEWQTAMFYHLLSLVSNDEATRLIYTVGPDEDKLFVATSPIRAQ